VIQRSSLINPMLKLVCERSGAHKVSKKPKHETTGSRKCGCMLMVSGYLSRQTNEWKLNILNGVPNHGMELALEEHMLAGRLNRGDKTVLQFLISKLEEHNYVYFSRTQSESTTIEDIFWAHPTFVKLFNNFPTILVMDSTYKTNMYKMPMFEIVGVTSTDLTFGWLWICDT
jgi:hypothetical protein